MQRKKSIHTEQYQNLITKLYNERKRLGISQVELSKHLGMKQSEVSKIESCERRLDILELRKMLEVYRVNENLQLKKIIIEFLKLEKE